MNAAREQDEVLANLVRVAFRRLGYNRVHLALVMPSTLAAATHCGAPCTVLAPPVKAWCDRTLRGSLVVIPNDKLDNWKRNGHMCRECVLIARAALALILDRAAK